MGKTQVTMNFTEQELKNETARLFEKLQRVGWSEPDCTLIAPLTLEINQLKKEKNAIILAHSYQTPDIQYGIADMLGDSYGLSMEASKTDADIIVFCSVEFMAETAKILNPNKTVLIPKKAGCSLAEAIRPEDVRKLREDHPEAEVVCYVNTTAAVKAECDACCTSSNAAKVIENMGSEEVIYVPDSLMAQNLKTSKTIIPWKGRCIVHEEFTLERVKAIKNEHPEAEVLAHPECLPEVVKVADFVGSTEQMYDYIKNSDKKKFLLITECNLASRIKVELKDKEIIGTCAMCPYMKQINLKDVLGCLKSPTPDQVIELPENILKKAKRSIDRMVEIVEKK